MPKRDGLYTVTFGSRFFVPGNIYTDNLVVRRPPNRCFEYRGRYYIIFNDITFRISDGPATNYSRSSRAPLLVVALITRMEGEIIRAS